MYHPAKILWSRRRVKSVGEEKNEISEKKKNVHRGNESSENVSIFAANRYIFFKFHFLNFK